jgi:hypothetical protein
MRVTVAGTAMVAFLAGCLGTPQGLSGTRGISSEQQIRAEVWDMAFAGEVADMISKGCPKEFARNDAAYGTYRDALALEVIAYYRSQGLSDTEALAKFEEDMKIITRRNKDGEIGMNLGTRAAVKSRAASFMVTRGFDPAKPHLTCNIGREEIEAGQLIGRFLTPKGGA